MDCYRSLLSVAGAVLDADSSLHRNSAAVSDFVGFVAGKEPGIAGFHKAWTELLAWMDGYDFNAGFDFDGMKDKVDSLCMLGEKLVKLKEEAGKLEGLPDRYGLKDALEAVGDLDRRCKEEMSLEEIPSYLDFVQARTDYLSSLQKRFQGDGFQLDRIREMLADRQELLAKYRAFHTEIQEYLEAFPHTGADDFAVVEERLLSLEETDARVGSAAEKVDSIRGFCNRYNQKEIVKAFEKLVNEMEERMLFRDISHYAKRLNDISGRADAAMEGFEEDQRNLRKMAEELRQKRPDMWADDNRHLLKIADSLLGKDYREASFEFEKLKEGMRLAKEARRTVVEEDQEQYGWLASGKYNERFQELIAGSITENEYKTGLAAIKKDHSKKVLKIVGIVLAVIAVIAVCAAPGGTVIILPGIAIIVAWLYSKIKNKNKK